jgi:transcriptional regulator with XRE-family HTH domain
MNVGLKIKLLRESRNISREQMTDKLPMSINTYKKIEYGEKIPTLDELKIIAEILNVDPVIFLKDENTSIINHGDYSTGIGNVIINEKDIILSLSASLESFATAIHALSNALANYNNK